MAEIKNDDGKYILHKGVKYRTKQCELTPGWYTYSPHDNVSAFIRRAEMPKAVRDLLED